MFSPPVWLPLSESPLVPERALDARAVLFDPLDPPTRTSTSARRRVLMVSRVGTQIRGLQALNDALTAGWRVAHIRSSQGARTDFRAAIVLDPPGSVSMPAPSAVHPDCAFLAA